MGPTRLGPASTAQPEEGHCHSWVSGSGPTRMLHAAGNPVQSQCKVDFKCSSLTFEFSQRSAAYPSPRTLEIHAEPPRGSRPLHGVLWFVTDLSFREIISNRRIFPALSLGEVRYPNRKQKEPAHEPGFYLPPT